ncbi:MAG: hypothetical protein RBS72_00305 [Sedimentisphaerales bacterium]|jgi:hypothetical protein|nr:hypothetical protein [Sedimentisphaerales bacterium]HNY76953.1 hypothetical protein [Sedimentisphaerales bacterium]HOC62807.1 hypothetical protein [Sedimentisphaerales bacterium]HOH62727.1 hypothetical protein [Sedimentisphaerales bacterium]HQA88805.1 hypothetical protein [Sedimentisphaerales bacterium]
MKTATRRILVVSLIGHVFAASGCYNCARCLRKTTAECRVEKSARAGFVSGSKLVVRDNDGAINVRAGDEMDCHVTATAFIHAPTKREAAEIGEQLEIVAERDAGRLLIAVRKPSMPQEHRFVSVDLDIVVPRAAHVDCETTFGRVRLAGLTGDVKASTQFGSITCEDIRGSLDLETQLGRITCREIAAEHIVASSQKGSIDISCVDACPAELVADVSTEWGKIRFQAPAQYQGALDLESEMGSVKLDKDADVGGAVENSFLHDRVSGRIGSGAGNLRLFSNLGSVALR